MGTPPAERGVCAPLGGGMLEPKTVLTPREVSKWPYTVGRGGYLPLGPPPPPDQSDHSEQKRQFSIWEILSAIFWNTRFWVPDAPPLSF